MQATDIDIQLWAYIDDTCTPDERERVAALVADDAVWKNKYEELLGFHQSVQTELEAAHVSDSFANNVMVKIEAPVAQKNKSTFILTWGIRAVAAFFIISIGAVLIYYITTADVSIAATAPTVWPDVTIPASVKPAINMLAGFSVLIFLLVAADSMFRRRMV